MVKLAKNKADFILSTDTLWWYWLDIIFDLAKSAWFKWIDLAMRKNLDAWNPKYVKKLSKKYDIPVRVIQTSAKVNAKEMNQALTLCEELWTKIITINAPAYFNMKTYNFLIDNLPNYRKHNQDIKFSIINPIEDNYFLIPIPKYHFRNIVEIIKKYWSYLALDISHLNQDLLEWEFLHKLQKFIPHLSVIYFSDKTKLWKPHILPWDWTLKLTKILKRLKKELFSWYLSLKIDINKNDLADLDKTLLILQKAVHFYHENYEEVEIQLD